jgi:hypothetical protein
MSSSSFPAIVIAQVKGEKLVNLLEIGTSGKNLLYRTQNYVKRLRNQ